MESSVYDELHTVLQDLTDQRKQLQKQIDSNNLQIHEAECFAEEIFSKDEEDFTVFSPRRYEDIYRTQLDQSNARKAGLESQNQALKDKRNELDGMICRDEMILGPMNVNDNSPEEFDKMIQYIKSVRGDYKKLQKDLENHSNSMLTNHHYLLNQRFSWILSLHQKMALL